MVLMKVKTRCCENRTVRGLEDEHAQVRDGGQICPVQRCVVLGNGTVEGHGGVAKVQCSEITEVSKPLTDRGLKTTVIYYCSCLESVGRFCCLGGSQPGMADLGWVHSCI